MLVAAPCLRIANIVLQSSQASHEAAISTITHASQFLVSAPLPDALHLTCVMLLKDVVLFADRMGHSLLVLYFAILSQL